VLYIFDNFFCLYLHLVACLSPSRNDSNFVLTLFHLYVRPRRRSVCSYPLMWNALCDRIIRYLSISFHSLFAWLYLNIFTSISKHSTCIISFDCLFIDNAFFSGLFDTIFLFFVYPLLYLFVCVIRFFFSFCYCILRTAFLIRLVYTLESGIIELPYSGTARQSIVPICIIKQM
jgi:hypothetical protein